MSDELKKLKSKHIIRTESCELYQKLIKDYEFLLLENADLLDVINDYKFDMNRLEERVEYFRNEMKTFEKKYNDLKSETEQNKYTLSSYSVNKDADYGDDDCAII